jgi:hypothetical protein
MNNRYENMWKVRDLHSKEVQMDIQGWLQNEIFSWTWWILLLFMFVPWWVWFKVVDRTKMLEILLFGTLVIIFTLILDATGNDFGFWAYPTQLLPIAPEAFEFDLSMVPVGLMLVYQYFKTWKSFIKALIVMSFFYSFICEPLCHVLGMVQYIKWNYMYSFIYYITTGILIRLMVEKIKKLYS